MTGVHVLKALFNVMILLCSSITHLHGRNVNINDGSYEDLGLNDKKSNIHMS